MSFTEIDKKIAKLEDEGDMIGNPVKYLNEIFKQLKLIDERLKKLEEG